MRPSLKAQNARIAERMRQARTSGLIRCDCGHAILIHTAYGCEGVYTKIDEQAGIGQAGPCPCRRFFEKVMP